MDTLKRIGSQVFYQSPDHSCDQPCLYAIVGEKRTLMIDGGVSAGLASQFVDSLHAQTGRGVDFVVLTHWHWDHTFGLHGVKAPVIASANTAAHLKRMAGYTSWSDEALDGRIQSKEEIVFCAENIKKVYPGAARNDIRIRQPDVVFAGGMTICLDGVSCEIIPLPAVHTDDSVAIHVPEQRLLFIGDSTGQNSYDHPAYYSAPAVMELFRWIESKGAGLIMESHAEPATPEEFMKSNSILLDAARGVLAGCSDSNCLKQWLQATCAYELPVDTDEVVDLFISGIGR